MEENSIKNILNTAKSEHTLTKPDIVNLLQNGGEALINAADSVRRKYIGDGVYIRALIEFSNYCTRTCYYCGLRAENNRVHRYRMSPEEIAANSYAAIEKGFKTIVLQSGEDCGFSVDEICRVIERIKKKDVAVTLSIGEKSFAEYSRLKSAGADRYLLRIETTNKKLYQKYHPKMSFENRLRCLEDLCKLGYEVGTGSLIGLEGQTVDMIAEDVLFFKEIDADMLGIGVFIPHPDTPLGTAAAGDFNLTLRTIAICRLLLPDINIPAATAMETLKPEGRKLALSAGANVVMLNAAENVDYKKEYSIYPDKAGVNERLEESLSALEISLAKIGRKIIMSSGFRYNNRCG